MNTFQIQNKYGIKMDAHQRMLDGKCWYVMRTDKGQIKFPADSIQEARDFRSNIIFMQKMCKRAQNFSGSKTWKDTWFVVMEENVKTILGDKYQEFLEDDFS